MLGRWSAVVFLPTPVYWAVSPPPNLVEEPVGQPPVLGIGHQCLPLEQQQGTPVCFGQELFKLLKYAGSIFLWFISELRSGMKHTLQEQSPGLFLKPTINGKDQSPKEIVLRRRNYIGKGLLARNRLAPRRPKRP